ncbi:MAG: L,D-transpeptidase family protein [Desulfovibrio sp.]|nr:L,D-transpeptidase family protein [Desulfovibrio sp.]
MKKLLNFLGLCCVVALVSSFFYISTNSKELDTLEVASLKVAKTTNQVIIVAQTKQSEGTLSFYQREGGTWRKILSAPAYLGKNGIDKKIEGDGKTPTGQFHFTMAFGIAPNPGSVLNYTQVNETHYWNSDPTSSTYNQFVSTEKVKDFNKAESEHLITYKKAYDYCLNISYNEEGRPMLGSAIFLHCYSGRPYTAGCVTIPREAMLTILGMVTKNCQIIIDNSLKIKNY